MKVIISGLKSKGDSISAIPENAKRIFKYYPPIDRTFLLNSVFNEPFVFDPKGSRVGTPFLGKYFFYVVSHKQDVGFATPDTQGGDIKMEFNFGKVTSQERGGLRSRATRYYNTTSGMGGADPLSLSHLNFLASGNKKEIEEFERSWIKLIHTGTGRQNATAELETDEMYKRRIASYNETLEEMIKTLEVL